MATAALVSVEEYLNSDYSPDCDYVDGEVVERNMGELKHGALQLRLGMWLSARAAQFGIYVAVEVRVQVSAARCRVPDVVALRADAPREAVVRQAPLLCVEVLSRRDSLTDILGRVAEYHAMGVPVCWIVDPLSGSAWISTAAGLVTVTDGVMRAGEIEMPLAEVLE